MKCVFQFGIYMKIKSKRPITLCKFQGCAWWFVVSGFTPDFSSRYSGGNRTQSAPETCTEPLGKIVGNILLHG